MTASRSLSQLWRRAAKVLAALGGCLLAASFAGALHPAFDALAVVRAPLACVTAAAMLAFSGLARLGGLLACGAVLLGVAAPFLSPTRPGSASAAARAGVTLYQKNLFYSLGDETALLEDIRASGAQILTLQEVGPRGLTTVIGALSRDLPNHHWCPRKTPWGIAIATSLPVVPGSQGCDRGLARLQVEVNGQRVWIVAVHLFWPWPFRQPGQVDQLLAGLQHLVGPVILAGDFNAVPAMTIPNRLGDAVGAQRAGPAHVTFTSHGLLLAIDHVYGPRGGWVERRGKLGSDHYGLLAHLPLP